MILTGLPPIIDPRARVLVLGSFPSAASLAAQQYYAHPQNQFWRIVGAVIGQPLKEMDYADRIGTVQAAGIAVWDVFASCERAGSLDSAIQNAVPNPLAELRKSAPALRRICFNGRMAARRIREVDALGYEAMVLPSTSPAHAGMTFEEKLARWRAALQSWPGNPMKLQLHPLQGEDRGGDCQTDSDTLTQHPFPPHPPPGLPLEGGGEKPHPPPGLPLEGGGEKPPPPPGRCAGHG